EGRETWSAYVPDLPGCVSGGETRAECEANTRYMRRLVRVPIKSIYTAWISNVAAFARRRWNRQPFLAQAFDVKFDRLADHPLHDKIGCERRCGHHKLSGTCSRTVIRLTN